MKDYLNDVINSKKNGLFICRLCCTTTSARVRWAR